MLTKNLQELIATGSIDKDEPLFQLIHQIQEENSRYLICLLYTSDAADEL